MPLTAAKSMIGINSILPIIPAWAVYRQDFFWEALSAHTSGLRFAYCGSYGLHRAKGKSRADHRGNCK